MNLKEAIKKNKLNQFIKEREGEASDKEAFDKTISVMSGKSPKAQEASSQEKDES